MSLPFILDVAIGLVLIYLILSLLASEVQELITTLLQWRAAHLKKSIEILLTGGEGTQDSESVKNIVEDLYSNPLIKNISQESKEGIEAVLRKIMRAIVVFGRKKTTLTKGNEPSYIPSETFATTLLTRLNLDEFSNNLTVLNFQKLVEYEINPKIEGYIHDPALHITDDSRQALSKSFEKLKSTFQEICDSLDAHKATLLVSTNRLRDELNYYIEKAKLLVQDAQLEQVDHYSVQAGEPFIQPDEPAVHSVESAAQSNETAVSSDATVIQPDQGLQQLEENTAPPDETSVQSEEHSTLPHDSFNQPPRSFEPQESYSAQIFIEQLTSVKQSIFYQGNDNTNNMDDLILRLKPNLAQLLEMLIHETSNATKTYKTFREEFDQAVDHPKLRKTYEAIETQIQDISKKLPPTVRESLAALAARAQINLRQVQAQSTTIEAELHQLKSEIQVWFDRSMSRASGVYKRNAKGVAFLIGVFLAWLANADTLHIMNRLTTDSALRSTLVQNATVITDNCPTNSEGQASNSLDCIRGKLERSIPLPLGWDGANLKQQQEEGSQWIYPPARRFLGWVISGFAISMGASFWFDLLGKIINVRNSGKPPESSTNR